MYSDIILAQLAGLNYRIQNTLLRFLMFAIFKRVSNVSQVRKIVVFRTGTIGDSISTIPSLIAVRKTYTASQITLLTSGGKISSLSIYNLASPVIFDNYIDYTDLSRNELLYKLKALSVDLFIELPQPFNSFKTNLRNLVFAKLIRAKYAFGWEVYANTLFKKNQNQYNNFKNEAERLLDILERNGIKRSELIFPLNITEENEKNVAQLLSAHGLLIKQKNIALVIGAKRETNRWPLEYFKQLKDHLSAKGYNLILVGGPEDTEYALSLSGPRVFDFTGKLSPLESAVLLKHCLFTISNDTGPLHLSYAVGTPVIGIYSNRDYPKQWFPPAVVLNYVFRAGNIPCTICLREICNKDKICMHAIKPADVILKADEFAGMLQVKN